MLIINNNTIDLHKDSFISDLFCDAFFLFEIRLDTIRGEYQ